MTDVLDQQFGTGGHDGYESSGYDAERMPPQDLLAEQSAIGGMLLSQEALADVLEYVAPQDFYTPKHEIIYRAIVDLYSRGEPIDVIQVADELTKTGQLTRAGGMDYLHSLTSIVPTAANAGYYAQIVSEKSVLRRLVEAGTRIVQMGYASEGEVTDLVNHAQAEVFAVTGEEAQTDYVALSEALGEATSEIEAAQSGTGELAGIPTGFHELDELTNGLKPGQMVIIAARPGMGKSTLALDFARSSALKQKQTTAFFSLEMGRSEIAMKLLSAESNILMTKLRKGSLDERDWKTLAQVRGRVNDAPLFIDDSPNMTLVEIRAKCRRLKQQHGLRMVVIDYLQLLSSGKQRVESRQQEVSEFSRSLKLLAKELQVPVVALSQLNRNAEARSDRRPQISDLRESGSIEQDADIVMLLHRDDAYEPDVRPGEADIIVAKHRGGPTKTIPVAFHGHLQRFADLAHAEPAPQFAAPPAGI